MKIIPYNSPMKTAYIIAQECGFSNPPDFLKAYPFPSPLKFLISGQYYELTDAQCERTSQDLNNLLLRRAEQMKQDPNALDDYTGEMLKELGRIDDMKPPSDFTSADIRKFFNLMTLGQICARHYESEKRVLDVNARSDIQLCHTTVDPTTQIRSINMVWYDTPSKQIFVTIGYMARICSGFGGAPSLTFETPHTPGIQYSAEQACLELGAEEEKHALQHHFEPERYVQAVNRSNPLAAYDTEWHEQEIGPQNNRLMKDFNQEKSVQAQTEYHQAKLREVGLSK